MTEVAIDRPYVDFEHAKTLPLPAIPRRDGSAHLALDCVGQAYQVTVEQLLGTKKHKNLAEARRVAYWVLRTLTRLSWNEIGGLLNRDHTSALAGVRVCERQRVRDAGFRAFTDELATAVKARLERAT